MNIVLINIDKEAPARHLLTTIVHQLCWDEVQECFWQTQFSALLGLIVSTEGRRASIRLPGADNQGSSERAVILMALYRWMDRPPHLSIDSLYCTDRGCLEQIIQMCVVWNATSVPAVSWLKKSSTSVGLMAFYESSTTVCFAFKNMDLILCCVCRHCQQYYTVLLINEHMR